MHQSQFLTDRLDQSGLVSSRTGTSRDWVPVRLGDKSDWHPVLTGTSRPVKDWGLYSSWDDFFWSFQCIIAFVVWLSVITTTTSHGIDRGTKNLFDTVYPVGLGTSRDWYQSDWYPVNWHCCIPNSNVSLPKLTLPSMIPVKNRSLR